MTFERHPIQHGLSRLSIDNTSQAPLSIPALRPVRLPQGHGYRPVSSPIVEPPTSSELQKIQSKYDPFLKQYQFEIRNSVNTTKGRTIREQLESIEALRSTYLDHLIDGLNTVSQANSHNLQFESGLDNESIRMFEYLPDRINIYDVTFDPYMNIFIPQDGGKYNNKGWNIAPNDSRTHYRLIMAEPNILYTWDNITSIRRDPEPASVIRNPNKSKYPKWMKAHAYRPVTTPTVPIEQSAEVQKIVSITEPKLKLLSQKVNQRGDTKSRDEYLTYLVSVMNNIARANGSKLRFSYYDNRCIQIDEPLPNGNINEYMVHLAYGNEWLIPDEKGEYDSIGNNIDVSYTPENRFDSRPMETNPLKMWQMLTSIRKYPPTSVVKATHSYRPTNSPTVAPTPSPRVQAIVKKAQPRLKRYMSDIQTDSSHGIKVNVKRSNYLNYLSSILNNISQELGSNLDFIASQETYILVIDKSNSLKILAFLRFADNNYWIVPDPNGPCDSEGRILRNPEQSKERYKIVDSSPDALKMWSYFAQVRQHPQQTPGIAYPITEVKR